MTQGEKPQHSEATLKGNLISPLFTSTAVTEAFIKPICSVLSL